MSHSDADAGYREAARRFPRSVPSRDIPLRDQHFTMEDLLDGSGTQGRAEAAARFHGNTSAREALDELRSAIQYLDRA